MPLRSALPGLMLALVALLAGCSSDQGLVNETLDVRGQAINESNSQLYMSAIADDYDHEGATKADLAIEVSKLFSDWKGIEFQTFDREIVFEGDKAVVNQGFSVRITPSGGAAEPSIIKDKERIVLERSGSFLGREWRISDFVSSGLDMIGSPEDRAMIEQALAMREQAMNEKDVQGYLSTIADDYNFEGKTKVDLEQNIRQRFAFWSEIGLTTSNRKIVFYGDKALVDQKIHFRLVPVDTSREPVTMDNEERIVLRRTGAPSSPAWKIAEGI